MILMIQITKTAQQISNINNLIVSPLSFAFNNSIVVLNTGSWTHCITTGSENDNWSIVGNNTRLNSTTVNLQFKDL